MPSRLLDAAACLLELAQTQRSMTFRRRVVSTAYYAVFHAIAQACADCVTRSTARHDDDYSRVYRSLEHGPMKNAFSQAPLKSDDRFSGIGAIVVQLQAEGHRADYLPPSTATFSKEKAEELVDLASKAVTDIELLASDLEACRTFVSNLLFRERRP